MVRKHNNKRNKGGNIANNVYTGVAIYGRIQTVMSTIFFTFISICLIGSGIYILTMKRPIVKESTTPSTSQKDPPPKWLGVLLLLLGIFILISSWVWLYYVWTNKGVAAVAGVADVADIGDDYGIGDAFADS